MKFQKGFTLIELMVVIVIIGILSALAVPKMFGTSAKAKAAEVPTVISNWESLQSAYIQERGSVGDEAAIGFHNPGAESKWFTYDGNTAAGTMTATPPVAFGNCAVGDQFISIYNATTDLADHSTSHGTCLSYTPNF
ncbi:MAG: prepilin-type N-terminal cleavage/methylation domain-containing protein [Fibrobacteres bacterium]|jgi:type IV pilus assembly protein PilA|nr:prepilin-type N-terminal cleavage/methylation domain-containing protein [Fibrobacterota bacterium]